MPNFGATNEPGTCKWCGRKLKHEGDTTWTRSDQPPKKCRGEAVYGLYYGASYNPCSNKTFTPDGVGWRCADGHHTQAPRKIAKREYRFEQPGCQGSGQFCTLQCGFNFAVVLARAGRTLVPKKKDAA